MATMILGTPLGYPFETMLFMVMLRAEPRFGELLLHAQLCDNRADKIDA